MSTATIEEKAKEIYDEVQESLRDRYAEVDNLLDHGHRDRAKACMDELCESFACRINASIPSDELAPEELRVAILMEGLRQQGVKSSL